MSDALHTDAQQTNTSRCIDASRWIQEGEGVSEKVRERERERERQMKPFFVCFKKTSLHSGGFTSGPVSQMRVMRQHD